jgi:hypothetical protein
VHYQFADERIGPTIPCKHIFLRSRGRKTVTLPAAANPSWHACGAPERCSAAANGQCAAARLCASVPIPKFAPLCGALGCELRNQRDTSNL